MKEIKVFGANAKVFLKYQADIKQLATKISKGLILSDFSIEHRESPPYDLTGSGEALGFQIWLDESNVVEGYNFILEMETELSDDELFLGQMHNLSPWLGRYIYRICDVQTCILGENGDILELK